ncbi:MAG TPA: site-specific integrase [Bellilinea sp.]|nr:site-specific integrase [Bellilinea sp.]
MINRDNWLDVKAYLRFQREIKQLDEETVQAQWSRLRHLMEWADKDAFDRSGRIRPTFPAYAERLTGPQGKPLAASHLAAIFKTTRNFYLWAKEEYPSRYRKIDQSFLQSLRPSRDRSEASELITRKLYTLEDVRRLVSVSVETEALRRAQAGTAFLFLSGMRIGAFVTLPLKCVDLAQRQIYQVPAMGVHTKNSKAAITYLLNIPDLLDVAEAWDRRVRRVLPPEGFWYAPLDRFGKLAPVETKGKRENLRSSFRDELQRLCELAGVEYLSPHKLRHGFSVYALKRATTPAQMKAISQNLMHANMGITDGIYARMVGNDVKDIISSL